MRKRAFMYGNCSFLIKRCRENQICHHFPVVLYWNHSKYGKVPITEFCGDDATHVVTNLASGEEEFVCFRCAKQMQITVCGISDGRVFSDTVKIPTVKIQ